MRISFGLALLLLCVLASSKICQRGHVQIEQTCTPCNNIENTDRLYPAIFLQPDQCVCKTGFSWGKQVKQCLSLSMLASPEDSDNWDQPAEDDDIIFYDESIEGPVRVLAVTCITKVQITLPSGKCFTCPSTNGGIGLANKTADNTTEFCECDTGFKWNPKTKVCDCDFTTHYINTKTKLCTACTSAGDGRGGCACSDATTSWYNNACVKCTSIPNGVLTPSNTTNCTICGKDSITFTVARKPGSNTDCTCKGKLTWSTKTFTCGCDTTKFKINPATASCDCDKSKAYLKGTTCTICPSSLQGDNKGGCKCIVEGETWDAVTSSCQNCSLVKNTVEVFDGLNKTCFVCGSGNNTIAKIATTDGFGCSCKGKLVWNSTSGACGCTDEKYKLDPVTLTCVCDLEKSYVQGSSCNLCDVNLTLGGDKKGGCKCSTNATEYWNGTACVDCTVVTTGGWLLTSLNTCFQCGSGGNTLIKKTTEDGDVCTCKAKLVWDPTGFCGCEVGFKLNQATLTCVCDLTRSYQFKTTCALCPSNTFRADGKGGCVCKDSTEVWSGDSCVPCNTLAGIIKANDVCFACGVDGTYTYKKVVDTNNDTCSCKKSGLVWDPTTLTCKCSDPLLSVNPKTLGCTCDFSKAYLASTKCAACNIDTTLGPDGKGGCLCTDPKIWNGPLGKCISPNEQAGIVVLADGSYFQCGTAGTFTVAKVKSDANDTCTCKNTTTMVWNAGGFCECKDPLFKVDSATGKCVCDLSKAYSYKTDCLACPSGGSPDGLGGCSCPTPATKVWVNNECVACSAASNSIVLPGADGKASTAADNVCFVCGTAGTNTVASVVTVSGVKTCKCKALNLKWNQKGFCDCGTTSALVAVGNSFTCVLCTGDRLAGISSKTTKECACKSAELQWSSTEKTCSCSFAPNSIVLGGGANAICFECVASDYETGVASVSKNTCGCFGKLVWNPISTACECPSPKEVPVGKGAAVKCVLCTSIKYAYLDADLGCVCNGTGLTINTDGVCACQAGSYINSHFVCTPCAATAVPVNPYECKCPAGNIWSSIRNTCEVCGSEDVPNSLSVEYNAEVCACAVGYFWDVMTQSCVESSTCATVGKDCMTCPPKGNVNHTIAVPAIDLLATNKTNKAFLNGAYVQGLLNNIFTNYDLIKKFQCPCDTGFSWDLKRYTCFDSVLA